jgi:hypothetical protein
MKSRILSTITLFSLAFALLIITPDYVSSQTSGCDPIFVPLTYNQTISDEINGQFWSFSYCFNGNAGDIVNISMNATSGDLDTYLELSDSKRIKLIDNNNIDQNSKNSLIQYTLPTTGAYYISASRSDGVTGTTSGGFSLTLNSSTSGSTQQGRPTSNTANTAPPTDVCNNVAKEMAFVGAAFNAAYTEKPLALLDDNASTGWSSDGTTEELWFDVVLNGTQTVTSIEFNGYAFSGTPANSVNVLGLTRWSADTESFETILDITASMQPGYQTYTFAPVTTDSLTFFLTTNHGGTNFEVADIKVCTDAVSTGNTAGRPTTNTSTTTTNQTESVAPTIPCTVQAINTSAELRVGPGTNRSIILYLSPDDTFDVIGTNTLEDGSRWWRLDKTKAAPKKAAQVNETWVSDAHMTEFGDCDAVGAVAAPRIIRAPRPAPQPNPATSSGGNTSGGNTSAPQPIPQEGSTDQFINFYADPGYIFEGECTTLHWLVQNVKEVYFIDYNGSEKRLTDPTGSGSETDCPTVPTGQTSLLTYALRVVPLSGADVYQYAEVTVDANFIDIGSCTPTLPFLSDGGTIDDRTQDSYSIFVEPCGEQAIIVEAYVGKGGGDMDPYLVVTDTNGNYYGEDNDSGADFDALLNFCVFEKATIVIEVSNAYTDGTGDYYIQVTTQEGFCG